MKTKLPKRRKFANEWDEIGYLYDKLLYWLYRREDARKAQTYAGRLERLLPKADPDHEAIFGEECWSLVHEARGDLPRAIRHRKNEIDLICRLHAFSHDQPFEKIALKGYEYPNLSDRLNLLATLYHDSGDLEKAISTLEKSKQLCANHGIEFDGEDTLQEYSNEKNRNRKNSR